MEAELRSAWIKAGLKLGLGLFVVAASIGIRIVTVAPQGLEADLEALERVADAADLEARAQAAPEPEAAPTRTEPSAVQRMTSGVFAGSSPSAREGDRMVSCRLQSGTQFMTANDCAMRGGRATLFESERP